MSQVFPNSTSRSTSMISGAGGGSYSPSSPESAAGSSSSSHLYSHHHPLSSLTSPLTEKQYLTYLDSDGRIKSFRDLRITVYRRGVEPNLRKTVWKQILNVYPPGLTGQQRIDYMKLKCESYQAMRSLWQNNLSHDARVENVYSMVGLLLPSQKSITT